MNEKTDWAFHPLSYYDDDSMENDRDTSNADKTQALKVQGRVTVKKLMLVPVIEKLQTINCIL